MATNTMGAFGRRMTVLARNIEPNVEKIIRKVALTADQVIVQETPVDTGRAKSNWIVSVGSPTTAPRDAYVEGSHGSTRAQNEQQAYDQAAAAVAGYRLGQAIFISNNLPYIGKLNEGSSAQAPAEFVQTAVVTAVLVVTNNRGLLNP